MTQKIPAIRGWKPLLLVDEVWGSLAIGRVIVGQVFLLWADGAVGVGALLSN